MSVKTDFYRYLKLFHNFTFNADNEYKDIELYNDRKIHFMSKVQTDLVDLRMSFLSRMSKDANFYDFYMNYMDKERDYILFMNLNLTAVDQKKFSKDWYNEFVAPITGSPIEGNKPPAVRFIAYWHQVMLWELSNAGITIAYWKSRDMGASFAVMGGMAMSMLHKGGQEFFLNSRVARDIDIAGDLTQTLIGKIRNLIDSTVLYSRDSFLVDKFMHLKESAYNGIIGVFGSNPARGGRGGRGLVDEAPADPKLDQTVSAMAESTSSVLYMGTLLNGYDTAFRNLVEASYKASVKELQELQDRIEKRLRDQESYSLVFSEEIKKFKETLEQGKTIAFTHNFESHPLKKNCKDYDTLMRNKLFNDPIKIAEEHLGLLNFGNPKRSFWGITDEHYQDDLLSKFNLSSAEVIAGFDPGGDGKAYLVPFVRYNGFYYMLPAEQMEKEDMKVWAARMRSKYPTMRIMAETSMNALKRVGEGWFHIWNNAGVESAVVTNRNPSLQLTCFNWMSIQKAMDYSDYTEKYKLIIDEKNKWFMSNFIQGGKYGSDPKQKEYSHPADAVIALIYSQFKELFESRDVGISSY